MGQSLLNRLAPRLNEMSKGGYRREYRRGRKISRNSLSNAVGELLRAIRADYKQNVPVPGTGLEADFAVNGMYLFVDRELDPSDLKKLGSLRNRCVLIRQDALRSDRADSGIRATQLGESRRQNAETIFLDDPSFNFDYAHILPHTQKCSVMHGHTSSVLVEVIGEPMNGMVIDFGDAKEIVRDAVRSLDHKLFINGKYVTREDTRSVTIKFRTVHGDFVIQAPKATTVLLEGEATVENLAAVLLSRLTPRMPSNVTAVGVYVYEGMNKGSHLLAQLHSEGEEGRRNRQ